MHKHDYTAVLPSHISYTTIYNDFEVLVEKYISLSFLSSKVSFFTKCVPVCKSICPYAALEIKLLHKFTPNSQQNMGG